MSAMTALLLLALLLAGGASADPSTRDAEPQAESAADAAPAGAPSPPAPPDPAPAANAPSVFSLSQIDRNLPVSIQAELLEAEEHEGYRTFSFQRDVQVRHGDLLLRTERLEAVYPEGAKQPSRLRARGGVLVRQRDREARCASADYDGATRRIVCTGDAVLSAGGDELHGERIVFDLAARRVSVEGGTRVEVTPRPGARSDVPTGFEGLATEGPIAIEAEHLDVWETAEGRHLRFDGSVRVAQEDLALSARQIEALYPPKAQQPQRVVARGDVVVTQGDREARCNEAEYQHAERWLRCQGDAQLLRGDDRVRGERIDFDLAEERVVVSGGATLHFTPRERPGAPEPAEGRL